MATGLDLYDITPTVSPRLGVWPGDTPLSREVLLDMSAGGSLTLSTLRATVHLGAHADAPNHYAVDGDPIDRRPLDRYLGPCQVVVVDIAPGMRIPRDALRVPIRAARVLFATGTYPDPEWFCEDFAAFEPALLDLLAAQGVILVGIDTPSIDLFDPKDLPAHATCRRHDLAILEGLVLVPSNHVVQPGLSRPVGSAECALVGLC